MAFLEIRKLGDPVLREKCSVVDSIDGEIKKLVKNMGDTLHREPGRVGLAACQVGVLKRIFVYDIGHGVRCFLNPQIIERARESLKEEGCLSIPGIFVQLPRHEVVRVKCTTLSGHDIVIETEGFLSQVMQHECDHLDGVLIIDRCDAQERRRALDEYEQLEIRRDWSGT